MDSEIEAKARKLVERYNTLLKENEKLKTQLLASKSLQSQLEVENKELKERLSEALLLKSIVIAEGDKAAAKKTLQAIIKDIDRCISHLYR